MSFDPLLHAGPVIAAHAFAAMAAFALGLAQLIAPKGTLPHRVFGWVWVGLMLLIALSSFWIHEIRQFGDFSAIHLLSVFTLASLPAGIYAARRNLKAHAGIMTGMFIGALVIAGGFTVLPGRIMHKVLFGG